MIALLNRTALLGLIKPIAPVAPAPVTRPVAVVPVTKPVAAVPVPLALAMPVSRLDPEAHSCGGRCGSHPSSSTPATAGGPGATPAAPPAPSLSLSTVGSAQLPPPAGSTPAKDSAPPKASDLGAWLQANGGLWLWVIVAIVLIVVLAGHGKGGRSTW